MAIDVLFFGGAREAAGLKREALPASPGTVADLRRVLLERHPALAAVLAQSRLAVDEELADDATPIPDGAEVAVIPPVAGG